MTQDTSKPFRPFIKKSKNCWGVPVWRVHFWGSIYYTPRFADFNTYRSAKANQKLHLEVYNNFYGER